MQCIKKMPGPVCVWKRSEPSSIAFLVYAAIIPILAMFGCVANCLNAFVFMRPKMTPSAFTYLTVLSGVDSLCCIIIFLTAISRSTFLDSMTWIHFDLRWQSPLFGTLTGAANWILVAVTLDRIIYLCNRLPQTPPKFCTRQIARRIVCGIMLMSTVLNAPYYFMFLIQDDGTFYTTKFFNSKIYKIHNWLSFTVLCIIPGMFLLFGNITVIIIFRRWVKRCKSIYGSGKDCPATRNRQQHQLKLTITVTIVVCLYMVGELPAHITSRKNAVNLLFGGDSSKINFEKVEQFEVFFLTMNAIQLSLNIVVYAVVNPSFMAEFFIFLKEISDVIFLILGISAFQKCWKKIRNKSQYQDENNVIVGDIENQVSISYYNEIFTAEEPDSVMVQPENLILKEIGAHHKWKSCIEFGLGLEERLKCGRLLQRHSLPL